MVRRPIIAALVCVALPVVGARAQEPGPFPAPKTEPPIVTPGRTNADPPSDAIILFDGKDLSHWRGKDGGTAKWNVRDGYVEVAPLALVTSRPLTNSATFSFTSSGRRRPSSKAKDRNAGTVASF
jgi:hypothetical protein